MDERCVLCGCRVHRSGDYAKPTTQGRSHATRHHFVAERFFGRSSNRRGDVRDRLFDTCPWDSEGKSAVYCYECHEELLHNPVFTPKDIEDFARLVAVRDLSEGTKSADRSKLAGRVKLLHEVIEVGIEVLLSRAREGRDVPSPKAGT